MGGLGKKKNVEPTSVRNLKKPKLGRVGAGNEKQDGRKLNPRSFLQLPFDGSIGDTGNPPSTFDQNGKIMQSLISEL